MFALSGFSIVSLGNCETDSSLFGVVSHDVKNKTIVSTVPFEPYNGKVCLTWKDVVFHPIASYNLYFHTPVTIFNAECHETIVLKAFQEVSNYFTWNQKENRYIYN